MPDAVARVGPRCSARRSGVEETNLTHERSAESKYRLGCTVARAVALSELDPSLDAIVVVNKESAPTRSLVTKPFCVVYVIDIFPLHAMTEETTEGLLRVVAVFGSLLLVLFTVQTYQYVRRPPKLRSIAIIVLGDVGRSPRMMYHAESFAKLGFDTYLIGYRGEWKTNSSNT